MVELPFWVGLLDPGAGVGLDGGGVGDEVAVCVAVGVGLGVGVGDGVGAFAGVDVGVGCAEVPDADPAPLLDPLPLLFGVVPPSKEMPPVNMQIAPGGITPLGNDLESLTGSSLA